jgi:hypothetical protein
MSDAKNYYRQRMVIWSGDRASGDVNQYTVQLRTHVNKCVSAEWCSSSVVGQLLSISQFSQPSVTTNGKPYWKFIPDLINGYYSDFRDKYWAPKNIGSLTIHWMNPDGTTASLTDEHCLEIEFVCVEKRED